MKRKLIAMLVFITIIASIMTVSVSAYGESIYSDYEAGELPENMFKTVAEHGGNVSAWWYAVGTISDSEGRVSRSQTNGYKGTSITAKGTPGGEMTGTSGAYYQINAGVYIGQELINSNNPNGIAGDIDDGKNYVYAMQVRNLDATYTPNVRFLLYDMDGPAGLNAKEWGIAGMPVTSTDWMDFKGTIQAPERNKADTVKDVDIISIGFNASTVAGSSIEMNFTDDSNGMYPMYFAEEVAYDITNELTAGSATMAEGSEATFAAQVLNQIELPGYLIQDIEWRVMNKARTANVDGFEITEGDGIATVTVNGAAPGTYDVVAYSQEYKMAKGVSITVCGEEVTNISIDTSAADKFTLKGVEVVKSDAESILVVAASYTKAEGIKKIKDVGKAVLTVKDGAVSLTDSITIDAPQGCDVRIFVWNASNLAPISLGDDVIAEYKIP